VRAISDETRRRAVAVLRALAAGDAIGAAADGYRPAEIADVYDGPITEILEPVNLYPESAPDRARAAVGPVTVSALIAAGRLAGTSPAPAAAAALGWAVALGIASPAGATATIVTAARDLAEAEAAAAGAAVAAAIAAGIDGYLARDAIGFAALAAESAGAAELADLIVRAAGAAQASGGRLVGTAVAAEAPPGPGSTAIVAFALGVAFGAQSVRRAILEAANQGGAASHTAALAGAICAAFAPASAVEAWADEVERANALDLRATAGELLALRTGRGDSNR
jgi:ADP-ribosylglycohydrolase